MDEYHVGIGDGMTVENGKPQWPHVFTIAFVDRAEAWRFALELLRNIEDAAPDDRIVLGRMGLLRTFDNGSGLATARKVGE